MIIIYSVFCKRIQERKSEYKWIQVEEEEEKEKLFKTNRYINLRIL